MLRYIFSVLGSAFAQCGASVYADNVAQNMEAVGLTVLASEEISLVAS